MLALSPIQQITVLIIPVLFAITLHEAAHAYAAHRAGDNTALMLGRLSLNPFRHIELFGTIIVPLLILVLSGFQFIFGWAKPVPINSRHFKNMRRDLILVAAAGPLANIAMALLWAFILKITLTSSSAALQNPATLFVVLSAKTGIIINLVLACLNLIPIPPLDGSKILSALLPYHWAQQYTRIEPFGFIILVLLLVTNLLSYLIIPPMQWLYTLIKILFQI